MDCEFKGRLTLSEELADMNKMRYLVSADGEEKDLSEILHNTYMSQMDRDVEVDIETIEHKDNCFNEKGSLYRDKLYGVKGNIYDYYVGDLGYGECLGDFLFENVGKEIKFSMKIGRKSKDSYYDLVG